ncbi:MAG: hypothetical protein HOL48_03695 [Porticoccaceae bacterium]|mgnify:CR=1 FL=1|nr:hypothetical protein [Porticoccaceae bacterium]
MIKNTLIYAALLAVLVGCGSSRDDTSLAPSSDGSAAISGTLQVGETLTASITDGDRVLSGSQSYQWYADGDLIAGATSSSYTLTAAEDGAEVTVVVRYTDSQGLRETNESSPSGEILDAFTLGATFVHGLVDGASCSIFAVDAAGVASTTAAATGTTTNGVVSFGDLVPIDGTGLIQCSGGTYTDEATGLLLDAPDTRAIVTVGADTNFTVTPLTEIAAQRAEVAGDLNTAVTDHNTAVATAFGISGDITEVTPTDLSTTALTDDDAGIYATALALISQLDANDAVTSTEELIENIVAELADGTLSEDALTEVATAQADLATSPFAANLDDTAFTIVENALSNAPEPATFEGLSATIPNDQETPLTGSITVADVNFGEDSVAAQTDAATTYGSFTITEDGQWEYTLDTTNASVSGLEVGQSINDSVALASADGTAASLVVRITALTQVAEIANTINGDTGELRLNLEEHLLEGKLSFSFYKTEALGDDGNEKDAYITLYGSSGSSSESLVDLRIQGEAEEDDGTIREPRFLVRNTDNDNYPGGIITAPFTPNEWYDIDIVWDMSQNEQVTIYINGEILGGGAFGTAAIVDSDFTTLDAWFAEGVERVQWRFGDNNTTIPFGSYNIDDVVIYSDAAGTTMVFEDNFEGSDIGVALGTAPYSADTVDAEVKSFDSGAPAEPTAAAIFNLTASIDADNAEVLMDTISVIDPDEGENMLVGQASTVTTYGTFSVLPAGMWEYTLDTTDATIAALVKGETETDTITVTTLDGTTADLVITIKGVIEVATGSDLAARIADRSDADAGELRYKPDAAILNGRMTATVLREAGAKAESPNEDAQIAIYGSSTSSSNAMAYITLDISGDDFDLRDSTGSSGGGSTDGFVEDQEFDIEIAWNASAATDAISPLVTIKIDGQVAFSGENFASPSASLSSGAGGVETIQFRVGGTSDVTAFGFIVDDFKVYSSDGGIEEEVFSDEFETYTVGNSLDPNAATASTAPIADAVSEADIDYHNDSFDVFVEAR